MSDVIEKFRKNSRLFNELESGQFIQRNLSSSGDAYLTPIFAFESWLTEVHNIKDPRDAETIDEHEANLKRIIRLYEENETIPEFFDVVAREVYDFTESYTARELFDDYLHEMTRVWASESFEEVKYRLFSSVFSETRK